MRDTIYRDDIVKLLKQRSIQLRGVYGDLGGAASGAAKLIINFPSAQPEQRWIPCSIKQPKKGLMLVTFNDGDIALLKQPTAYRRSDIVAWMPVEPYRGEGEEDAM